MIKTNLIQAFMLLILLTSCSSETTKQKLTGKWYYAVDEMINEATKKS